MSDDALIARLNEWTYVQPKLRADLDEAAARLRELVAERGTLICAGTTQNPEWTPLGKTIVRLESDLAAAESRAKALWEERAGIVEALDHDEDEYHERRTIVQTIDAWTRAYQERGRRIIAAESRAKALHAALHEQAARVRAETLEECAKACIDEYVNAVCTGEETDLARAIRALTLASAPAPGREEGAA